MRVLAAASRQPSGQGPARNGSGVRNLGQSSKSGGAWSKPLPRGRSFDQSTRFPGFILRAKYKSPVQRRARITKQNAGRLSAPYMPENLPSERTFDQKRLILRIWPPSEATIDHFEGKHGERDSGRNMRKESSTKRRTGSLEGAALKTKKRIPKESA